MCSRRAGPVQSSTIKCVREMRHVSDLGELQSATSTGVRTSGFIADITGILFFSVVILVNDRFTFCRVRNIIKQNICIITLKEIRYQCFDHVYTSISSSSLRYLPPFGHVGEIKDENNLLTTFLFKKLPS